MESVSPFKSVTKWLTKSDSEDIDANSFSLESLIPADVEDDFDEFSIQDVSPLSPLDTSNVGLLIFDAEETLMVEDAEDRDDDFLLPSISTNDSDDLPSSAT